MFCFFYQTMNFYEFVHQNDTPVIKYERITKMRLFHFFIVSASPAVASS